MFVRASHGSPFFAPAIAVISQHSKNLLEAFKQSSAASKPVERSAPAAAPSPVATPLAGPSPTPAVAPAPKTAAPAAATGTASGAAAGPWGSPAPRARRAPFASPLLVVGVAGLLLLVGAFFLGRWSKGASDAFAAGERSERPSLELALQGERDAAAAPAESSAGEAQPPSALLARPQAPTAADAALLDASNRYTIAAIEYDSTERNLALAKAVAAHFAKRSLPVCTPYQRGGKLFVVVGAAPNTVSLEELQRAVRSMDSPNGNKGEFASAYIVPIDSIVQRKP